MKITVELHHTPAFHQIGVFVETRNGRKTMLREYRGNPVLTPSQLEDAVALVSQEICQTVVASGGVQGTLTGL